MEPLFPTAYNPQDHEDSIYERWEKSGFFNPDTCEKDGIIKDGAPSFSIMLPPPNATGTLHVGHSAMLAIEDLMIRFHRMRGDRTLWLPGTDHAALATQEKVERILWDQKKQTRHDLGRESFLKEVEAFVQESRDTMRRQMRKMGSSLDWSREAYTLDEKRGRAVNEAFRHMYESGIIYRGGRIVNWDPKMHTTVSDDELEWKEESAPFYYLTYGPFIIGTSRPETKFGDKYVVMHPDDARYAHYTHGQRIENIEWINGPITATVIKDPSVDMTFGTGVMTITPWHDAIDFDIATRHNLEKEQIIDFDGRILPIAGPTFSGLTISEARIKIIDTLQKKGLIARVDKEYSHRIATNSRGGGIIEPQIKEQWFVSVSHEFERNGKMVTLKSLMQEAVRSGQIRFIPGRFEKIYFHWIDNLRDWCISRQIWYGHRIPAWYRGDEIVCSDSAPQGDGWRQDPDTLDTWFSSGIWTFSSLGWPDKTKDFETFHPTSVLETGSDILFFWVARMILMSTFLLGDIPFKTVYLHGLVRDEQGRKMSKSLGNVIDPLDIISEYGTDAIRLSLIVGTTPGNDLRIGKEKIASFRNFTNKLWNIGRYIAAQGPREDSEKPLLSTADHWILSRLINVASEVTGHIEKYQFSLAGEKLRDFTWNDFADWYIEINKIEHHNTVLHFAFETTLKLWHPFMPFATEALWSHLNKDSLLMIQQWPDNIEATIPDTFGIQVSEYRAQAFNDLIREPIENIRIARSTHRIPYTEKLAFFIKQTHGTDAGHPERSQAIRLIEENTDIFTRLGKLSEIRYASESESAQRILVSTRSISGFLLRRASGTSETTQERHQLEAEIKKITAYIENTNRRLSNPSFREKAPQELIANTETMLAEARTRKETVQKRLDELS